ncbi:MULTISPECIES: helix-turn-helix domain-containing protein [Paenibacillus]|uniref:Transcriptional regulator n=1 Tax=Paenibacillus vini TaxID=1476024 RepID=A0ABQ4MH73_9BACL|nr:MULTISPECIES: helix-turn-helix transcriptional regulator [Paenibacillus]MBQ4898557.1 helix-turn-helix transcriptional regulator [Paenibacillus sp. Marseille-P2973]MDN4069916.1 helix-turn-helix transcriptional regulator [Paenibacillus vini]GIP55326.1 transcriptional regulator [Paenibacillus vini]
MDYDALGRRLRQERHKMNWTQEKLAEKVEVSDAYIGQIERGERSLSLETLVKLANQLGVTVDYLLHDSIEITDDRFMNQIRQIMLSRSPKEKQLALDVIKLMFAHLDDMDPS